jgi:hypothetical protein
MLVHNGRTGDEVEPVNNKGMPEMNKQRRKEINKAIDLLTAAKASWEEALGLIESAGDEEQEYYDVMPESLQNSDKGQSAQSAADLLCEVKNDMQDCDIDDLIGKLDESTNQ